MTNTELKWIKEIRDNTKQLERIAKRLDVISRQLDRLDRKTENSSEIPNNCKPQSLLDAYIKMMDEEKDEPQTERSE